MPYVRRIALSPKSLIVNTIAYFEPSCSLVLRVVLIILAYSALTQPRSQRQDSTSFLRHQRRYRADSVDCPSVTEIVLIGFFPCVRNDSNFTALEKLSECDILAEAAAHLAVDRVNQDPTILPNITLRLHPVYTPTNQVFMIIYPVHVPIMPV